MKLEGMQQPENRNCFKSSLIDPEFRYGIKSLKDDPEKIIRFNHIGNGIKAEIREYNTSKNLFYELRDKYDIAVPDIENLINTNDAGQKSMIIVTDRIHGKNLDQVTFEEEDATVVEKYENLFDNLIQYHIDKYNNNELCIGDLKSEQFVYGKRKGDEEDMMYYVDVEPFFSKYERDKETGYSRRFFSTLSNLIHMIETAEKKINKSRINEGKNSDINQEIIPFLKEDSFFILSKARNKLLAFIDKLPSKVKKYEGIPLIIQELSVSKDDLMLKFLN